MSIRIMVGDCRELLRTLPERSVRCCITSPPYFGLRDYETATWEGGREDCAHQVGEIRTGLNMSKLSEAYRGGGKRAATAKPLYARGQCPHCGAVRIDEQIGLEPTPDEYVAAMVEVFREVRRVLTDDGTLWLNLGDSYASNAGGYSKNASRGKYSVISESAKSAAIPSQRRGTGDCKPKDLIGIPWRVAFALQADGWYLRSDIIWHKPNPMPESVTDRPTSAHEHVFLLAKSERYFYDAEAVKEPAAFGEPNAPGAIRSPHGQGFTRRAKGNAKTFRGGGAYTDHQSFKNGSAVERASTGNIPNETGLRNIRNVWTIATRPFPEAHFATFPPELVEPCLKAGSEQNDVVLDPFGGAGTTAMVADRMGRRAIMIELSPKFAEMARQRIQSDAGMFAQLEVAT